MVPDLFRESPTAPELRDCSRLHESTMEEFTANCRHPGTHRVESERMQVRPSFMNMDSNSGSPFFGLQLAVDSGSRPPRTQGRAEASDRATSPRTRSPAIPDHGKSGPEIPGSDSADTNGNAAMLSGLNGRPNLVTEDKRAVFAAGTCDRRYSPDEDDRSAAVGILKSTAPVR